MLRFVGQMFYWCARLAILAMIVAVVPREDAYTDEGYASLWLCSGTAAVLLSAFWRWSRPDAVQNWAPDP